MRAVVYNGAYDVGLREVPDPRIEHPADAIVRITTTNICGSNLHMYEGRTSVEEGKILGHQNMGIVEEVGPAVFRVEKGDRVSVPFNIACGICKNCQSGWTSFCLNTNPTDGVDGAAYDRLPRHRARRRAAGTHGGGVRSRAGRADGRAQRLHPRRCTRVPRRQGARSAATRREHRRRADRHLRRRSSRPDHRGEQGRGRPRRRVRRLPGARSVGGGASGARARQPGAGRAHDRCDRCRRGLSARGSRRERRAAERGPDPVAVRAVLHQGAADGHRAVPGEAVQPRAARVAGKARPSFIVSHELPLDEAPAGYDHFDKREDGWTKVLLHPAA